MTPFTLEISYLAPLIVLNIWDDPPPPQKKDKVNLQFIKLKLNSQFQHSSPAEVNVFVDKH